MLVAQEETKLLAASLIGQHQKSPKITEKKKKKKEEEEEKEGARRKRRR
jgi:hypothetical protein